MHWIVSTLVEQRSLKPLLNMLLDKRTTYTLVVSPPFSDYLFDYDGVSRLELQITGKTFCSGNTSMNLVARNYGWELGYIDVPGYDASLAAWGHHMLNSDAVIWRLDEAQPIDDLFFIRPVNDGKCFAGQLLEAGEFDAWRAKLLDGKDYEQMQAGELILMARPKRTLAEYRVFVVSGRVVTASRYKLGDRVTYSHEVPAEVLAFAGARIADWNPAPALAIDVAETDDGLKVVEINSISSAGFYDCDLSAYVDAINRL